MEKIAKQLRNLIFLLNFIVIISCSKEDKIMTGGLNGIVTNKVTGEPISGVNLTLSPGGLSKTNGNDGRYEFQQIEAQQYSVQASATGYTYNVRLISVTAGQTAKCDIQLMPK
jgi:hypothetical protein